MLVVIFDINGSTVPVSGPGGGRTTTGTFYKRKILGKLNKYFVNVDHDMAKRSLSTSGQRSSTPLVLLLFFGNEKSDSASPYTLLTRPGTYDLFPFS